MAEVIFILVIFYGVYVIQSVVKSNFSNKDKKATVAPLIPVVNSGMSNSEETKVVAKKKPIAKSSKTSIAKLVKGTLRNPQTGEVAKIASSYRMCKRWIKDALVTEGLLESIYKTSEVDDVVKVKINMALNKLSQMEKYQ